MDQSTQNFTCTMCGDAFSRQRVRGNPPRRCPPCRTRSWQQTRCPVCHTPFYPYRRGSEETSYCSTSCFRSTLRPDPFDAFAQKITRDPTRSDKAAYRRAMKTADPCAYCGEPTAGGIDHIVPTLGTGDRSDWSNMTASCHRCNAIKRTLPLLSALLWVPVSRSYNDMRRSLFAAAA